ncbi:WYL domain-containing protein [Epidermidibacterium keratini]|uniref:WYL domain-containing protein n=1 Tax=Epidermidibacterium keratini TaxID=1891644 RepID=A0A7L4YSL2_9ACTN|nr:WYL domain-containing protein [Epidermidibacterium keratini]QHC02052.1 WYL domain-containing protein [Epidermidibacterium keratini]
MASATSHAQLQRMSLLVPYVVSHPEVTVAELATEFAVSQDQIREDLNAVAFCGLPGQGMGDLIEVVYDEDRVTITEAAGIDRPLQLTTHEATALIVALRALVGQSGGVDSDAVTRALAKIESAVGDRGGSATVASLPTQPAPEQARTLRGALQQQRAVRLHYYVPTRDEVTDRVVDPLRLIRVDGQDYLEAWCRRAEDVRIFRLDRIESATVLDEPAAPPQVELRDVSDGIYTPEPDASIVALQLTAPGRWVAEYYETLERTDNDDGSVDLRLPISDPDTLRHLVASLGPDGLAGMVDEQVREAARVVADRSRAALRHYTD